MQQGQTDDRPAITIATRISTQNTVQVTIQDNGPGIPEDVQLRLFDPFFTTKPVDQGTTFTIDLPLLKLEEG